MYLYMTFTCFTPQSSSLGEPKALDLLKYMLLCKIMMNDVRGSAGSGSACQCPWVRSCVIGSAKGGAGVLSACTLSHFTRP